LYLLCTTIPRTAPYSVRILYRDTISFIAYSDIVQTAALKAFPLNLGLERGLKRRAERRYEENIEEEYRNNAATKAIDRTTCCRNRWPHHHQIQ